jgi:hypothetical protein
MYSTILKTIDNIDEKEIAVRFTDALRDYLNMQLYIQSEKILNMVRKNLAFEKNEII